MVPYFCHSMLTILGILSAYFHSTSLAVLCLAPSVRVLTCCKETGLSISTEMFPSHVASKDTWCVTTCWVNCIYCGLGNHNPALLKQVQMAVVDAAVAAEVYHIIPLSLASKSLQFVFQLRLIEHGDNTSHRDPVVEFKIRLKNILRNSRPGG